MRPDESEAGKDKVVVLSYGLWQRLLGGDRKAVGQQLQLNGESYEVVGVMPASFRDFFLRPAALWAPLAFRPEQFSDNQRTSEFLSLTARLRDGVTPEQAQGELHALATRLKTDYKDNYPPDWNLTLTTLNAKSTAGVKSGLLVLLGAVAFVLLIACANVANLQLARAASRGREIAVRVALGASPGALMRQLLTESVLLALAGGIVGLLIASWSVPALMGLGGRGNLPAAADIHTNPMVMGFTLLLSVFTGILFGLAPALQVTRTSLQESLKEGGRGAAGDRRGLRLRRGLVVATVAAGADPAGRRRAPGAQFLPPARGEPGIRPQPPAHLQRGPAGGPVHQRHDPGPGVPAHDDRRWARCPAWSSVGGTSVMPFGGSWSTGSFNVEGYQAPAEHPGPVGGYPHRHPRLPADHQGVAQGRAAVHRPGQRRARPRSSSWTRPWSSATGPMTTRSGNG